MSKKTYDMWYGVTCKTVMSSCMSAGCSLAGGRDTVPCLTITAIRTDFEGGLFIFFGVERPNKNNRGDILERVGAMDVMNGEHAAR
jgi:hypothetical protein